MTARVRINSQSGHVNVSIAKGISRQRLTIVDVRMNGGEAEIFAEDLDLLVVLPRLHLLDALLVRQNQTVIHRVSLFRPSYGLFSRF